MSQPPWQDPYSNKLQGADGQPFLWEDETEQPPLPPVQTGVPFGINPGSRQNTQPDLRGANPRNPYAPPVRQQGNSSFATKSPGFQPPDPDGFFTPAHPKTAQPQRAAPMVDAPPVYQGSITSTAVPRPMDREASALESASVDHPPDDRLVYQAPPRQRNVIVYLYIGLAVLVIILGIAGFSQLFGQQQVRTAIVTISEQGTTYSGNALMIRNESVFQHESVSDVTYTAEEGAAVNRGDPVCTVYTAGFSIKELTQLQNYRSQIKEYHKILMASSDTPDTRLQRLDTDVLEKALETQALVRGAHGNLLNQETLLKEAIAQRHVYLKQKYPDDTKLTRLYDNESNQLQRIETWTKQFTAVDNGIASFYTDGLEGALNAANYQNYSPQEVRDMLAGKVPEAFRRSKSTMDIYRLIRQYNWGALMLADDMSWNPVIGDKYKMLIESFDSTSVDATVESVTRSGGDMLVRLRVDSAVEPILYIRSARVQLSKSVITYAVPASAVISQDGLIGVVVLFKEGPYLVPVEVVSRDATQAHVIPVNEGHLYEGLNVQLF